MIENPKVAGTRWSSNKKLANEEPQTKRSLNRKQPKAEQKKPRHLLPGINSPAIKGPPAKSTDVRDRHEKNNIIPEVPSSNRRTSTKQKSKQKAQHESTRSSNHNNIITLQYTTLPNLKTHEQVPGPHKFHSTGMVNKNTNFICGIPLIIQTLQQVPQADEKRQTAPAEIVTKEQEQQKQETPQQPKPELFKKWKRGSLIGSGSTSEVYKILDQETGLIAAGKNIAIFPGDDPSVAKSIKSQLDILCKLEHPNIVKFFKYVELPSEIWFFMEYLPETLEMVYQNYGAIKPETVSSYARQLLQAVKYLHDNKIIHKDIKCSNILVNTDGTIKLSDFGSSKKLDQSISGNFGMTLKGSVRWMAPQILKDNRYGRKSDIWSVGCTVLEMATGKLPWAEKDFENYMTAIYEIGNSDQIPFIPEGLPPSLDEFLRLCLIRDPQHRSSIDQLLQSKFLNQ